MNDQIYLPGSRADSPEHSTVRNIHCKISPNCGSFHRIDDLVADTPGIIRKSLLKVASQTEDVLIYALVGNLTQLRERLAESDSVKTFRCRQPGDEALLYVEAESVDEGSSVFRTLCQTKSAVVTPIQITATSQFHVRIVGPYEWLQSDFEQLSKVATVQIGKCKEYESPWAASDTWAKGNLKSNITDRQLEALRKAVDEGYYELPRAIGSAELADELNCEQSTLLGHLRAAEEKLFKELG